MPKFILSVFILLMMVSSGCNNPSGGSVIGRGNAPFLQKPVAFAFTQIRSVDGNVDIVWQESKRVASYEFYIGTDPSNITTVVPECSGVVESCRILGLDPDTLYYFDIKATNDAGSIKVTNVGKARSVYSFSTTGATAGDGNITLTWNPSTNATSYNVIYGTASGTYPSTVTNVTSPYVLSGLTNGVRYYVRLVAVNGDNGYALSTNEVNQQPYGPLPAPTGLTLTATPGQILLDWADSAGTTNYKIFKGLTAGSVAEIVNAHVPSTYTDVGTTDGTSYFYAIKAFNGFDSTMSTVASARSISAFNITSAVAGPAPSQVTVTWPDTTGEDAYDIRYGSNPAALNLTASNVTSPYTFSGLTGGLPYFFRVVARNAIGAGTTQLSTNQLTATPIAPIAAPVGLTATSSPGSVLLNWTAVPGATEYRVYRGLTAGTVAFYAGAVPSNFYTDNGAANGTTYFYSVRAFNGYDSLDSAQVSTRPISSFALTGATVASFSSVDLTWGAATGAATYDIRYGISPGNYTTTVTNRTSPTTLTGLSASTTYYIAIRANNAVGAGTNIISNELTFTTTTLFPTVTMTTYPLINNANKASYTVSGACSENGRNVVVNVGSVSSTVTCTALAWTATMNVTAAAESAALALSAVHTNSGGNSATANRTVIKDTTNPTVAITSSPAINNTNKAAYTVSGSCSENTRTVSVSVGGVTASPICTTLAWTSTVDVSAVTDGAAIAITADINDAAGNNATQATVSVVKDTSIPTVTITSSPVIYNGNKNAYTVSGTCSETGQIVTIMVGSVNTSNTCTLLTWSATVNVSGNPDSGTLLITADHSDVAGNAAVQAATTVLKDTANPTVAITSSPVINNANKAAYTVSGTCSENTRAVSVSVGGIVTTPTCTTLAWTTTLDVQALVDGPAISITANHTDSAGNSATQASTTVIKNTGLPTVTIASSPIINNTNKAAYTLGGACSENGRIVSVNVGGVAATPTCSSLAWTTTVNVTAVGDGAAISITADHTDSVGNNANQASTTVLKDTVIPTVAITSSPAINNTNKAGYTVSGSCSDNTRNVSVNVGGVASTPVCTALVWSATVNVTAVVDGGSVSITANHTDAAGNAATQASTTVVKDTSIPTVTIASYPAINNANKAAYTVSGACSENTRTVSVNVGGVAATPTCTGLAWTTTLDASIVADGAAISITADHTDASGNSATQATRSVVKDTSNPTVAITSTPVINNANKAAYTVSGTCSETGQNVSVYVGTTNSVVSCSLLTWSATMNVTGNADSATLVVTADHSDAVGNPAMQAGTSTLKDTTNPSVAITSSPTINNANKAAYTVSGTCTENTRTVSVSVGGVAGTPTCTALAWSTTLNVTAVADNAAVSITANHNDSAGNNATQASITAIKNTGVPTVTIAVSPIINNTNKAVYTVSGACSENTRTVSVNVGGVAATPTCTTLAWSATVNVTGILDGGAIAITADHSDSVGNNAVQASTTVLKDTVVPTVAITSSPIINNSNKAAYTVSGTCSEETRTVSVSVGGVAATPTCTASAWSATVNVTAVGDNAALSITANHTDAAGNNATQASTTVIKDTNVPTVAITSSTIINNANKAAYIVSGTCSENTRTVSVSVGGVAATPTCTATAWSATINVTGVADGAAISILADHSDVNGNTATQASTTVVKDTANPTVAITSSPIINNANKAAYTVSGTCSENTRTVSVNVGGVAATPTCTASAWSATVNVTAVGDNAALSITANHSDVNGNNATQDSTTVLKDTVIPTVAITSAPDINNSNKGAYPISGTCSENTRTVTVNVGGVTSTPVCTASAWSAVMNVIGVTDANGINVTANHTDAAGNPAAQANDTVDKNTGLPSVAITSSPSINNANKAAYTVSGTCSENTRTVTVNVGGVAATPTCTAAAWSATVNATGVPDSATVSITADHTDSVGNNATQATATVLKDVIIPTVAITSSPVINNSNKAAYIVSGTCSENTISVTVSVGGVAATPACTATAWSATVNVTAVADGGSVSITANHSDAAGNPATQASTTVVKDTAIPTVLITSSPAINNTNKASYTVSGTCSENTRTVTVNVGGVASSPVCTASAWSATVNATGIADSGSVSITADHSDASGNNATQATTSVVKDTAVPTVAITSSLAINNTNKAAYTVSGTCTENTRTVAVNVGGVAATPTCTASAWSTTVNVTGVADSGSVSITADHSDASGNAATQATASVLKDIIIPLVAITSSPAINNTNKAVYPISGTCSENTRTVTVNVGGVSGTPTCTAGTWSTTLDVTLVGDSASVTATANHTDLAGNAATQASTTVAKDTTAPTVAITSSPAINNTNKAAYPISGTCSENTRAVSVNVGGVTASPTCTALAWSTTLNFSALGDSGSVAVTADHNDASLNNATQASTTIAKDTVIPTVAITSSPAINNANKAAYTVSGTCSENTRTVSVNVGGQTATPTCTALAWSATLSVIAVTDNAAVTISADHTDAALNNATQATTTVVKDTSNPTVAITSAPLINNVNKAAYTVSGNCSENTRAVTVSVGGVGATPTCTGLAWTATVDVTAVGDSAAVSVTANHTDAVGNAATQASTTVVKDTTPPTVAVTSSTIINNANKGGYTVSGTCSENTRTVTVSVGGVGATPTCSAGTWSTSVNVTAVGDGASITITADHSDASGNAATQSSITVLKDTVIPTVAIGSAPVINNANKSAYIVSGSCSENTRTVSVNVGGVAGTPTCTALAWTTTLDVSGVADSASVAVTANHTDAAANAATTASTTVVKDANVPTVAITSSPIIFNGNKATYTVSGTCSENTRPVSINVGGIAATPTCSALAWSSTLDVTSVGDGAAVSITANHTDANGNAATQASTTVLKDTVAPTVAITSSPAINNSNKAGYTVSGTCSENTRTVVVSIGGVLASGTCTALAWTTGAVNVTAAVDSGTLSITANHADAAGNSAPQASTTVVKDTSNPTVAITSSPVINNANKTSYTVSGTCSETGQNVVVNVGSVNTSYSCTLLTWSVTVDVSGNPDSATLLITADHSDASGNTSVQAGTTVLKDTANPTVAITSSPLINNANKAAYTVSGTCSENTRQVSVNIGGVAATPTCSAGAWSTGAINVTAAADSATLSITANHTDSAGNSANQASTTVIKDTSNPSVAITSSPTINIANQTGYTVSGTCSENTRTVTVSVGGVAATPTCSGGAWSTGAINVSAATDSATLSITANHSDANGNAATQATASVLKDTVSPTVALTTTEPATTSNTPWTVRATFSEAVTGVALGDFVVGNGTPSSLVNVSGTTYDITVTPTAEGTVTINMAAAIANDTAGNGNAIAAQLSRTFVTPAVLTYAIATTHDFGSVNIGASSELSILVNKTGTFNATSVSEIGLAAPYAFKGGAYPGTGGTCTTTISGSCTLVIVYTPTTAAVHNDAIQLQYNNGSSTVSASRSLTGTGVSNPATKIAVTGPAGILTNQCIPYVINSQAADGTNANVGAAQTITLVVNNGSGTFYPTNACGTLTTTATIAAGTSSTTVYFRSTVQPQNLTLVFNPASLSSTTVDVATSGNPTKIAFTTPIEMERNSCVPIAVALTDAAGNEVGKAVPVQVNLAQNGAAVFYSDVNCTGVITSVTYPAYTETKTIYVKDGTAQAVLMTFTDNAALLTADSATVNFVNALTWYNAAYLKRIPITLNNQDQATLHTDIPVLVKLNSSNIDYADTLAGGADIRFTLDDHTTALSYEIEKWDTTGDSFVWVKIPSIAASADKVIYMYYNNTLASDGQSPANTWTGFFGVWNMKKTGANYYDSTNSGKNGVPSGAGVTDVAGVTGNAINVNGSSSIDVGSNLATVIGNNSTFSFWTKTTISGHPQFWNAPGITGVRDDSAAKNEIYYGYLNNSGNIGINAKDGTGKVSTFVVNDGTWRHVTMSRVASTGAVKFYINGVLSTGGGTSNAGVVTSTFTKFGAVTNVAGGVVYWTGAMDGLRLKNTVLTDAQVRAEYKFSVQTNISYGAVENY